MRRCRLYPVHDGPHAFRWEWRSEQCGTRSQQKFSLFHDCVEDARRQGFTVVMDRPVGELSPGRHALAPQA